MSSNSVRYGYLDSAPGQVHYARSGESGPTIVLVHDSPLSSYVYVPALPNLGEWSQAWALDTPGYGMSTPPAQALEIDGYADLILQAARKINPEQVYLVGTHTGASIVIEAARQAPEYVAGIALNGIPSYDEETRLSRLASWCPDIHLKDDGSHLNEIWDRYTNLMKQADAESIHKSVVTVLSVWERYNWAYNSVFRNRPNDTLAELTVPILSFAAEGDALVPFTKASAEQFGFEFHSIPGISGRVPKSAPVEFNRLLKDFIQRVESSKQPQP